MSKIVPMRRCPLLSEFSFAEASMMAPFFLEEKHASGHVLLKEGAPSHGLIIIASGHALLSQASGLSLRLGMGDYFGEYALVLNDSASAFRVESDGDAEFLRIAPSDFSALKEKHAPLAFKLLEAILRSTAKKIEDVRPWVSQLPDFIS